MQNKKNFFALERYFVYTFVAKIVIITANIYLPLFGQYFEIKIIVAGFFLPSSACSYFLTFAYVFVLSPHCLSFESDYGYKA